MAAKPRVLFVNRFYWPEEPATGQLLTDLAEALAASGDFVIEVITSASRAESLPGLESRLGVTIHRLRTPRLGGRGALARVLDWLGFGLAALWHVARKVRRGDTLILLTDPPLLAAVAAPLAGCLGARVIHYVQDIYPELPVVLNGTRGLGPLRLIRNRAWRRADACVALGADMAAHIATQGVDASRIHVIANWAPRGLRPASPEQVSAKKSQWTLAGKFIVGYSGNLGRVHDLDPIIGLAAKLQSNPAIAFVFIGDGAQRAHLQAQADAGSLVNVRFLPHQPRSELSASLGAIDVHLVTLRAGCEALVFPSKLYGITAVGRPVLFIGPTGCELARQVEGSGMGRAFARSDIAGMVGAIAQWQADPAALAQNGRMALAFAHENSGLDHAAAIWRSLLTQARL